MKFGKLKILIFIICSVMSLSLFCLPKETSYAVDVSKDCYYLIDQNNHPYLSNVKAGTAQGYGEIILNEVATISANANSTFVIVGWYVVFDEQESNAHFYGLNEENIVYTYGEGDDQVDVVLSINSSSDSKSSELNISNVFESLTVEPVFDYIYYDVDITQLGDYIDLNQTINIDEDIVAYYSDLSSPIVDGETTIVDYYDTYIQKGYKKLYYGTLRSKTEHETTEYYSLHKKSVNNEVYEEILFDKGAFRLGEEVDISYNVGINDLNFDDKNIDVTGFGVIASSGNITLQKEKEKNTYTIEKDDYTRSKSYEVKFNVVQDNNRVNRLIMYYDLLYKLDFDITVDNLPIENLIIKHYENASVGGNSYANLYEQDGEFYRIVGGKKSVVNVEDASLITYSSIEETSIDEYQNILNMFTFNNAYHKIDGDSFLVKNKEDNGHVAFQLYVPETITDEINNLEYVYYQLDSSFKIMTTFENLVTNGTININYNSKRYYVDFKFALVYGDNLLDTSNTDFVMPNRLELVRGDVAIFAQDGIISYADANINVPQIIGYRFVGYSYADGDVFENGSYKINYLNPTSLSVVSNNPLYLCYEKVEYTVTLCNYNQIHLGETGSFVYPINNITLNYNINNISSFDTLTQSHLTLETFTLNKTLKINDSISFDISANSGFNIDGLTLDLSSADYLTEITFDEEFIETLNNETNVNLYVVESFIFYTVEYSTSSTIGAGDEVTVHSSISADVPIYATIMQYDAGNNVVLDGDTTSVVVKFVISNLKYGDEIVFYSTPVMIGELYYNFVMFTEDHKVGLNYNIENSAEPHTYSHNDIVNADKSLYVIYSSPTTQLNIMFSKLNAYNFGDDNEHNIIVKQNGERIYNQNNDGSISYNIIAGSEITILLDENKINKGYKLINYELVVAGISSTDSDALSFSFIADNGVHLLTFNFDTVVYHIYLSQYGAGFTGEYVQNESNDYFVLDVENLALEFNKPEGYYISNAVATNVEDSQVISGLIGSNDDRTIEDIISLTFEFELEDFVNLTDNFAIENDNVFDLFVNIDYSTYLYQMIVGYRLTNPKNDYRDNNVTFPNISLTYTCNSVTSTKNYDARSENNLTFVGIPYGATNVTLQVGSNISNGLEVAGWTYSNDYYIGTDFVNTDNYLIIPEIKKDYGFLFKLSYAAYNLNLNYDKTKGNPIVYINDIRITDLNNVQIAQYDKLRIEANVSRSKGYRFVSMTFESNDDEAETIEYLESIYQVAAFDVANHLVLASGIDFNINYDLLYMNVVNIAQDSVSSSATLHGAGRGDAKIDINLNDYASYKVYATDIKTDIRREITDFDSVTIDDIIELYVTINTNAHNNAVDAYGNLLDDSVYDLTKGLKLTNVNISGVAYSFVELAIGSGTYYATFGLSDKVDSATYLIDMIPENNNIDIRYSYTVQTKTISVTTNINDDSFYENRKFNSYIDQSIYGFGSGQQQQNGKFTTSSLQFLARARIGYFLNEYESYFKITSLKVKSNGVNINVNEYGEYGIVIYTRKLTVDADGNSHAELVVREDLNDVVSALEIRYLENIDIILELQPILYFAGKEADLGTTTFSKVYAYACDGNGKSVYQQISVGTNYLTYDIAADSIILSNMNITYKNSKGVIVGACRYNSSSWGGMTDVGEYTISITFEDNGTYQWLSQLNLPNEITVNVVQRNIYLVVDGELEIVEDEYDGLETTNRYDILKYLYIQDGLGLNIPYINSASNNGFIILTGLNGYRVEHTKEVDGVQVPFSQASDVLYNLYVSNLMLDPNNQFNSNFKLMNNSVVFNNCFKINKRLIYINGVKVYDKIYDGTRNGWVNPNSVITLYNTIAGDNVIVNVSDIVATFDSINVGKNKIVSLDLSNALNRESTVNYYFNNITINNATVYPSQLTAKIDGIGNISIYNIAGLTDPSKVDLIPVGAQLDVTVIKSDSTDYAKIFPYITQYLTNSNVFSVGFGLRLRVDGEYKTISNELHLSVPKVKGLTGVINLSNKESSRVQYVVEDENVIIDLSSVDDSISMIILTQKRSFFQLWQIILIVAGSVAMVTGVVVTFVVIRRKRKKKFEDINDTI